MDRDDVTPAGAYCVTARRHACSCPSSPEPSLRNVQQINEAYFLHAN